MGLFGFQTLKHEGGDVTPVQFAEYFADALGLLYGRALAVMLAMGEWNSFKVANIFHIAAQKGNVEVVLADLEKWAELAYLEPPANEDVFIQREVETRRFFDAMYARYFMPEVVAGPSTQRIIVPGESTQPPHQLILPSGLYY